MIGSARDSCATSAWRTKSSCAEAGAILGRLRGAPEVAVMPHAESPAVMTTVRNACARAGYVFGIAKI